MVVGNASKGLLVKSLGKWPFWSLERNTKISTQLQFSTDPGWIEPALLLQGSTQCSASGLMTTLPYQEFELVTGTEDNCNAGKTNAVIVFISKEIFPAFFCFVCLSCSMLLLHARLPAEMEFVH